MKTKAITTMNIGDTFMVEYGDYDNWTEAVITDIQPTEYDHIKVVSYTIPHYCGSEVFTDRMIEVDVK